MNSTFGVDECAGVCTSSNISYFGNLSGCTLTFTGTIAGGWYAMAIQVNSSSLCIQI